MKTLKKQTLQNTGEQLTLFPVDSLASHTLTLGSEEARKMTATSGQRCAALYARYSHVSSWAKMLVDSLLGTTEWFSTKLLLTWKMKDMRHKRFLFQLVGRTPHTEETESGLWPTPNTIERGRPEIAEHMRDANLSLYTRRNKEGTQRQFSITDYAIYKNLLPTPSAIDANIEGRPLTDGKSISLKTGIRYGISLPQMANNQMLPTPMAQHRETTLEKTLERKEKYGGEKRAMYLENYAAMALLPTPRVKGHGNSHQRIEDGKIDDLTTMAKRGMLPTPMSNDWKGSAGPSENWKGKGDLAVQAHEIMNVPRGTTSQLNPLFVAEMMGFPPNWTVLPFQSGETSQLKDTEMP